MQIFRSCVVPVWCWFHTLKQIRYFCFCKLWLNYYFQRETDSHYCRANQICSPWKQNQLLKHKCDHPRWGGKKVSVCTKDGIVQIWKKSTAISWLCTLFLPSGPSPPHQLLWKKHHTYQKFTKFLSKSKCKSKQMQLQMLCSSTLLGHTSQPCNCHT